MGRCPGSTPLNCKLPSVGDSVFGPVLSSIVIKSYNQPHGKLASRIMHRRPDNWRMIADYNKVYRNIAATIKHFCLRTADLKKPKMYWITTLGRWMKDLDDPKDEWDKSRKPVYGVPLDNQLVLIVKSYNDRAISMTNMKLDDNVE